MDAIKIVEPLGFDTPADAAGNLSGILAEIENGGSFDEVCLATLKRVDRQLVETKARLRAAILY